MMLGNLLLILVLGVVIYLMIKKGGFCCGGHDHGDHKAHDSHPGPGRGGPDLGRQRQGPEIAETIAEKDPVCGMEVHDHSIASSYLDRTFHFCSQQCRKLFDLNPNRYARS